MGNNLGVAKHFLPGPIAKASGLAKERLLSAHTLTSGYLQHTVMYTHVHTTALGPSLARTCSPIAIFPPPKSEVSLVLTGLISALTP